MKTIKLLILFITIIFWNNTNAQTKEYTILLGKALNSLYADLPNDCKNLFGKEDEIYKGNYQSKISLPNSAVNEFCTVNEQPIEFTSYVGAGNDNNKAIIQYNNICKAIMATTINYKNVNYKILTVKSQLGNHPSNHYKLENGPEELENVEISVFLTLNTNVTQKYVYEIGVGIYGEVKEETSQVDGCISGDCKNGKGSIEFNSGDKYEGDFKKGYAEGQGKYTEKSGTVYTGSLRKGKWDGFGTTVFVNGDVYIGNYIDDKQDGKGTFTYANGDILDGIYSNGNIKKGKFLAINGNYYVGEFENVVMNGQGKFYNKSNNKVFEGIFKDGKFVKEISKITPTQESKTEVRDAENVTTSLGKLNNYLKKFADGHYGYFEVIGNDIYLRFKAGKYNKYKIDEMAYAEIEEQYKRVILPCKYSKKCIYTDWKTGGGYEEYTQFILENQSFNYQELADLLNNFIASIKGNRN